MMHHINPFPLTLLPSLIDVILGSFGFMGNAVLTVLLEPDGVRPYEHLLDKGLFDTFTGFHARVKQAGDPSNNSSLEACL